MVVTVVFLPVNMLTILQEEDISHLNRYIDASQYIHTSISP